MGDDVVSPSSSSLRVNWGHAKGAWSGEFTGPWLFDPGQFAGGPVASDFTQLHPDQVVVAIVEALDNVLEDLEADLPAIEIKPGPVANQDARFAPGDHLGQPAVPEVGRDELIGRPG